MLRDDAIKYLGPTYADAKYVKNFKPDALYGRNILLESFPQPLYKSFVKSYLLNSGMRFKHLTKSGRDVIQAYVNKDDPSEFKELETIDLLVLYLAADPTNSFYSNVLVALMEKRKFNNLPTWIATANPFKGGVFKGMYGAGLVEYIENEFVGISRDEFAKR